MTAPDPAVPPNSSVARDTSPTWELEMFISGAVLFSLFQLSAVLEGVIDRWEPHTTRTVAIGLIVLYSYFKGAIYTLIAAFVLHLAVRAYWVGLIGLDSVFSKGIQWDRTTVGPVAKEIYRTRMPTLPSMIARLDNFASIIFSFAFLVVMVALVSVAIATVLGTLAWLITRITGRGDTLVVAGALFALLTVPGVIAALVDRKRSDRFPIGGRARGLLQRVLSVFYHTQLIGLLGPVLYTITSNGRRKTTFAIFYGVLIGSVYFAIGEWMVRRGVVTLNGADYFSTSADTHAIDYAFYESQWAATVVNVSTPSIQGDIIRDPFLRLFIPYQPKRHNSGIPARCPGLAPLEKRGIQLMRATRVPPVPDSAAARVLSCLATMHGVGINGSAVPGITFRFAAHPKTGINGIVAYLPVGDLPKGQNILTVMPPPRAPGSTVTRPLEPWQIPFWL